MTETAEVEIKTTEEESIIATEAKETANQKQTLESIVKEEQDKRAEADKAKKDDSEKVKKDDSEKANELEKAKADKDHKVTASERVQKAVNEKNEAVKRAEEAETVVTSMKSEIQSLRDDLKGITDQLAKGEISKSEAEEQAKDAQDVFQKVIEKIDMPDDLEPYKDTLARIAFEMADALIGSKVNPIEAKLKEAELKLQEREEKETVKQREDFVNKNFENYKAVAMEYPHLFGEPDEEGMPVMKPEIEKEAMQFASAYNVQVGEIDGNPSFYNPVLSTKEGLQMLFGYLNRSVDAAQKAKDKIDKEKEAIAKAKKVRIESPESHHGTSAKKLTLEQIVQEEIDKRR